MKHFMVATHGLFSREIINSAGLILGNNTEIIHLCMCEKTTGDEIREQIKSALAGYGEDDDVIIMTDVLGGSICTLCSEFLCDSRVHVLTGVNMPMLLTVLAMQEFTDTKTLIENCIVSAKEGICYVNQLSRQEEKDDLI